MTEIIKEMVPDARRSAINCDYEYAAFATINDCFRDAEIRGCLFHFPQILLKQMKSMGLIGSYNSNLDFVLHVKMLTSLSFVPYDGIDRRVDSLATAFPDELVLLLNWFEDNYIGRPHRRETGKRQSLLPTEM